MSMQQPVSFGASFFLVVAVASAQQVNRQAETESYDASSPEAATYSTADIVVVNSNQIGGGGVQWSAVEMGLPLSANIDAFSDGSDILPPLPPVGCRTVFIEYTVDRASLGIPGSIVAAQATPGGNGAASDTFGLQWDSGGLTYYHASDALAVTARSTNGATETDLDALAWLERQRWPVYFSVDAVTATMLGVSAADVLTSMGNGTYAVYLSEASLGLASGDDVDALAVSDVAGDVVLSLTKGSPSSLAGPFAGVAAAGLLRFSGAPPLTPYVAPLTLTLDAASDELDGVRITDPVRFHACDGSQLVPAKAFPWDSILIDGYGGNVPHVVPMNVGQPFLFEIRPLNPTNGWICLATPGRPCVCNELAVPNTGYLSFGSFGPGCPGGPPIVLFFGQGPLVIPTQVNVPVEITLQLVLGQSTILHTSNAVTLVVQ